MSSTRFPGKVLAPLVGRSVLAWTLAAVATAMEFDRITVATSDEVSDDPLAAHAAQLGVSVYRGPLNDVHARFRGCLAAYPCDWFLRVCADSPLLEGDMLRNMIRQLDDRYDLVTNVFPRTFPKGRSAEFVRSASFLGLDPVGLSDEEREHVTRPFYNRPALFSIHNVTSSDDAELPDLAVDTVEDLHRIETFVRRSRVGKA